MQETHFTKNSYCAQNIIIDKLLFGHEMSSNPNISKEKLISNPKLKDKTSSNAERMITKYI